MGFHTFDADGADRLERPAVRYRWVSAEEIVGPFAADAFGVLADLGSGTGFYTDDVAEHAETVYGVDVQSEMHEYYREKGVPENVDLVASNVSDLPFADGELDGAFSTMTYHEFASPEAIDEVARVLRADGRFVAFDWSADGDGDHGPPVAERFSVSEARDALTAAGFDVERAETRTETFALVARAP